MRNLPTDVMTMLFVDIFYLWRVQVTICISATEIFLLFSFISPRSWQLSFLSSLSIFDKQVSPMLSILCYMCFIARFECLWKYERFWNFLFSQIHILKYSMSLHRNERWNKMVSNSLNLKSCYFKQIPITFQLIY